MGAAPEVAIVMGSQSDWPTMRCAAEALDKLGVTYEARIVSAHRTPDRLTAPLANAARRSGVRCAETIRASWATPSLSSASAAQRIVGQSDWLPMTIATGALTQRSFR